MFPANYFPKVYFSGYYFTPVEGEVIVPEVPLTYNYALYRRRRR